MKQLTAAAVLAMAFVMVSCHKENGQSAGGMQPSDIPITFSSPAFRFETKAAGSTTTASIRTSAFGVTAYWTDGGYVFDGVDPGHNYMLNVRPVYDGVIGGKETWSFSPKAYWPLSGGLSFFAYAPWMADDSPNHQIETGIYGIYPGGRFTQNTNPSTMIDFCIANPVYDLKGIDGSVDLVFSHALTNVLFYLNIKGVVYPGEDYKYRLKSMTISGIVGENTYYYGNGTQSFHWTELPRQDLSTRTASYTLSRANGQIVSTLLPHEKDLSPSATGFDRYTYVNSPTAGVLYMLPQPVAQTAKVTFTLTACTESGGVVTEVRDLDPIEVWLPETTVWEPGMVVAYCISLDTTVWTETLFSTQISVWSDTSTSANVFDNAVYITRDGASCSVASVGNGFSAGDLSVNPPKLYVNGSLTTVTSWTHIGMTLTAVTAGGTYRFALDGDSLPTTVTVIG